MCEDELYDPKIYWPENSRGYWTEEPKIYFIEEDMIGRKEGITGIIFGND